MSIYWIMFGIVFALWLAFVAWTSLKFGREDPVDLRWLKAKVLTDKQVRMMRRLGMSDDEIKDLTK